MVLNKAIVIILILPIFAGMGLAQTRPTSISVLPFAMYDSDTGVGLGVKGVLKNHGQSYDCTLFGSSKGEQWYKLSYSSLDREIRRGKMYDLAFDFSLEYEKILKSGYYGIGNWTSDNDSTFPREFFKVNPSISRALTPLLSGSLSLRYVNYSAYGYLSAWPIFLSSTPGAGESQLAAVGLSLSYDARDSDINPRSGYRAMVGWEYSPEIFGLDWKFWKARTELSGYHPVFGQNDIIAIRLWAEQLGGTAPFQELCKIGDGWTARGYKAGRFLDKSMALTSLEYRFPLYLKLGGVVFTDAGRVWPSLADFSLADWNFNWGTGLRYHMTNFVTRLDIGKSVEGYRVFFNFGQAF